MAIELHHLHPGHDDELSRLKARIADLESLNHDLCERVTENDDIRLHWEEIEQTKAENERIKARIAELEERIADGDKDFEMANSQNERLLKIVIHHKYKRCLAMARWCEAFKELNRYGDQDYMDFAEKWHKRWLELSEKFKDKEK